MIHTLLAVASKHIEEMFTRCYVHSNAFSSFRSSTTYTCVTRRERVSNANVQDPDSQSEAVSPQVKERLHHIEERHHIEDTKETSFDTITFM